MDITPHTEGPAEQPAMSAVVQAMPVYVQPRKRSLLGRIFLAILLIGLLGSLFLNFLLFAIVGVLGFGAAQTDGRVQEKFFSHQKLATNKVAILSIEGTIISGEGFFKQQIDHAIKDAEAGQLKALVVRVTSPGGTITGSDFIYHHLREFAKETKLPIVVSMGSIAASGGYYVSMAVGETPDSIFAEPTTWTGSIGVIIPHFNFAGLMKELGIAEDSIASGYLKQMG
ncbi:MAG TPA: S49 family peptidase, partial [Thermoguttaceae bacterium]